MLHHNHVLFFSSPQNHLSVYVWVLLGYPPLVVAHGVLCMLSWILVVTIPVAKMSIRTLSNVLLMRPEDVLINDTTGVRRHKDVHLLQSFIV